jgi:hypothetical protein
MRGASARQGEERRRAGEKRLAILPGIILWLFCGYLIDIPRRSSYTSSPVRGDFQQKLDEISGVKNKRLPTGFLRRF